MAIFELLGDEVVKELRDVVAPLTLNHIARTFFRVHPSSIADYYRACGVETAEEKQEQITYIWGRLQYYLELQEVAE